MSGVAALRRFTRVRANTPSCGLCGHPIAEQHDHLVEPARRQLMCACTACALLFDRDHMRFQRIDRRRPTRIAMETIAEGWDGLDLPVSLAFVARWTRRDEGGEIIESVVATSPSPLGTVDHPIHEAAFADLAALHPSIAAMRANLEALLVHRPRRVAFVVSIDRCFHLSGELRSGLESGAVIDRFFSSLEPAHA